MKPQTASSRAWPLVLLSALAWPALASATNGYFSHGYGVRAQGVAGVAIALPQDGLAAAANPAGTALVGDRFDLGVSLFRPDRGASIRGNAYGADGDYSANQTRNFIIPEAAYVRRLAPDLAWGVAVYGNGGMNTDYARNPFAAYGGSGSAGVDLSQLFITPSVAFRPVENHAFGAALTFAYQRFAAEGLQAFDNPAVSSSPGAVTNRGHDSSTGWGLKLGWTGQVLPTLKLGASWSSRIEMGELGRYRGLFEGGGGFDIPANYGLGLAWQALPALTLAADWQRIEYSSVKAVGNPLAVLLQGGQLGADKGAGFGWRDVSVLKLGAIYAVDDRLTLRAGVSRTQQPVPASQTFFNVLAPGVVRNHFSLGASLKTGSGEWSAAYTRAPRTRVAGQGSIPASFGGGEADVYLREDVFTLGYSWVL
ncbi:OmpP1/FadL family transporter [Zoogloea sp.]|uniref:OmpP1/FadL family transporter n=1 Tax=Zoogloea sp. TaxID=49181 RepID=UPI0025D02C5F|nr:outer membrane protein transport protein [Zoogloea sp.]MCK6395487.1 outer membrane protein transport protein [Zoogloea sp.]